MPAIQATVPGKARNWDYRVPADHRGNRQLIQVKPAFDLFLDGPPDHSEICSIVWRDGRRWVKFVNRSCPNHKTIPCILEPAF